MHKPMPAYDRGRWTPIENSIPHLQICRSSDLIPPHRMKSYVRATSAHTFIVNNIIITLTPFHLYITS